LIERTSKILGNFGGVSFLNSNEGMHAYAFLCRETKNTPDASLCSSRFWFKWEPVIREGWFYNFYTWSSLVDTRSVSFVMTNRRWWNFFYGRI